MSPFSTPSFGSNGVGMWKNQSGSDWKISSEILCKIRRVKILVHLYTYMLKYQYYVYVSIQYICWSHRWFNVSLISSKNSFTILPSESDLKRTYCHSLSHDVIWQSSKVGCSINATHNVWTPSEPKQFSPQAFATKCPWPFSANISPYNTISHPQLWKQQPNFLKLRIFMVERLTLKFIKVSKKAVANIFFCVCFFGVKIKGSSRIT